MDSRPRERITLSYISAIPPVEGVPMAFGLFKDGEELFNAALEEINRKEYDKASKTLSKALEKKSSKSDLARVYIAMIDVGKDLNSSKPYVDLKNALVGLGADSFRFGLSEFDKDALIKECDAMARCIDARNSGGQDEARGNALLQAAQNLMATVGENTLRINEYYSGNSISGTRMATGLMAEANECLANAAYWNDPQKAAEYQQQAYNYRRQNGESGDANLQKMQQYSKACTCWFCGRQVVGEGLHFYVLRADPSPQQIDKDSKELQHSISEDHDIYVCRACYTGVTNRADEISSDYYNRGLENLRQSEARLQTQIAAVEAQVSRLQSQVSMMRIN